MAQELAADNLPPDAKATISYADAFVLGVVEGITEYLPISSTGHLILANNLLGLDAETPLYDRQGEPLLTEDENGEPEPFTLKHAADGYAIIIQGGAILAVALLYWQRLMRAFIGGVGIGLLPLFQVLPQLQPLKRYFHHDDIALARNLIVAFLPAAVLGLLLDDLIESHLFGTGPVVIALFAGALLMLFVEWRRRRTHVMHATEGPDLHEINVRQCLIIGFLQCVAMWPGTSRSMMTLVGGYLVGLNPVRAAEFSFLLGFITLTAASTYKTLQMGETMMQALDIGPILFGIFVATIAAALAVKWLVSYLTRHGLAVFAWYRIVLAIAVFVFIGV